MVKIVLWSYLITSCGVVPTDCQCSGLQSHLSLFREWSHILFTYAQKFLQQNKAQPLNHRTEKSQYFKRWSKATAFNMADLIINPKVKSCDPKSRHAKLPAFRRCLPIPPTTSHLPPNNPCMPPTSMQPSSGESHVTAYRTGHRQLKGTPAADSPI